MKKIVLFTGAGINVPVGLPIAKGFSATIQKCPYKLRNHLYGYLNEHKHDLEKVLYAVEELMDSNGFYRYLYKDYVRRKYDYTNEIDDLKKEAKSFQKIIKRDIFLLLQNFKVEKASVIYLNLLKELIKVHSEISISIFTTNYDLVFEEVFSDFEKEFNKIGFTRAYYSFPEKSGRFIFDSREDFQWASNIIEYNKLHGSLDWTEDLRGNIIKTGVVSEPKFPEKMPIIYPGYKGFPTNEPFVSMHEKLFLRMLQCDEVNVIGFAFRDPYISSIFDFALKSSPKLKVYCFNPCEVKNLPSESSIPNLIQAYPNKFKYIPKGISENTDPLKLSRDFSQ